MGYGVRCFLFNEDGTIKRMPLSFATALYKEGACFQEYANQTLKLLNAHYTLNNRQIVSFDSVEGFIVKFDENGSPAASTRDTIRLVLETLPGLDPDSKDKQTKCLFINKHLGRFVWHPNQNELELVKKSLWAKKKRKSPKVIPIMSVQHSHQHQQQDDNMAFDIEKESEVYSDTDDLLTMGMKLYSAIEHGDEKFIN